ncbi:hypothetical protein GC105_10655 [Alkalibaculum sp. M08DMB]|uniref:Uncharacterized protein n=1 Tax=Alkalibaculum sporogenes TaxID=2655001 RepID=A0A6A7K9T1_9FIRM|nr:hypothetical protein [Alkalibaculum sporogenes]MPW26248.1 hypothetical protein [Alkalibaculum sporogenes]
MDNYIQMILEYFDTHEKSLIDNEKYEELKEKIKKDIALGKKEIFEVVKGLKTEDIEDSVKLTSTINKVSNLKVKLNYLSFIMRKKKLPCGISKLKNVFYGDDEEEITFDYAHLRVEDDEDGEHWYVLFGNAENKELLFSLTYHKPLKIILVLGENEKYQGKAILRSSNLTEVELSGSSKLEKI